MPRLMPLVAPPIAATARWVSSVSCRSDRLDRWVALGASLAIVGYQKVLSPLKGYRCAHSMATGGPSCSDVALTAFRRCTFSEALLITERQFADCRRAYMDGLPDAVDQALRLLPDLQGGSGWGVQVCGGDAGCDPCPGSGDIKPP